MAIRIGVAGTGRLGRVHARILAGLDEVGFVGCYDADAETARSVAEPLGATPFNSLDEMLEAVDAVSIVVPTTAHCEVAVRALESDLDVFVEKPLARTVAEGERMCEAAREHGRILQVGHVERFNSAVRAVIDSIEAPSFIEVHRLAPFSIRGTDVSVVGDLMIHDLDLLGYILGEWPGEIRAKGASILTRSPDIVNVRLEYPGGCVANVTASRVTLEPMRKVRVFSPESYVSMDLLRGSATRYRKARGFEERVVELQRDPAAAGGLNLTDFIELETIAPDRGEPLKRELDAFCRSIVTREAPPVTGEDGLRAVRLATEILARLQENDAP